MTQKDNRKKIVFLGTPEVACVVLSTLLQKASSFVKIVLVVSQPPSRSTRSRAEILSPVHALSLGNGIPVLTPETAKDPEFLNDLASLEPDLCVTAAYGNYLPSSFLKIPKYGTVNIHPSLLPLYRGAAPVQRTLENGDSHTGVSLLYTVQAMDAGPIIAQETFDVDNEIKSPELLNVLFKMGADLLVKNLKNIFNPQFVATQQDHERATHAKKITIEESFLNFNLPALTLHNKVRAFASWPGTKIIFNINSQPLECKIVSTSVGDNERNLKAKEVYMDKNTFEIACGDRKTLQIKEIQPSGKKLLSAKDFYNGLKTKEIQLIQPSTVK